MPEGSDHWRIGLCSKTHLSMSKSGHNVKTGHNCNGNIRNKLNVLLSLHQKWSYVYMFSQRHFQIVPNKNLIKYWNKWNHLASVRSQVVVPHHKHPTPWKDLIESNWYFQNDNKWKHCSIRSVEPLNKAHDIKPILSGVPLKKVSSFPKSYKFVHRLRVFNLDAKLNYILRF